MKDIFDTVKEEKAERKENVCMRHIYNAMHHWNNMQKVRDEGERCHRFVNGDQWSDKIKVGNRWITEKAALMEQGYAPRTVNLMNRVVKNVMGVVLKNGNQPTAFSIDGEEQGACDVINKLIEANNTQNETKLLWPLQFKQFMEWGMMISKQTYGFMNGKWGCWNENIDPRNFFCDTGIEDVRGWDCNMVGMIHTLTLDDILASFCSNKTSSKGRAKHKSIIDAYGQCKDRRHVSNLFSEYFGKSKARNVDFLFPKNGDLCRVIEIWTKETKPRYYVHDNLDGTMHVIEESEYESFVVAENQKRIELAMMSHVPYEDIETAQKIVDGELEGVQMPAGCRLRVAEWHEDRYWYYRFMTPNGYVLDEGETPYLHKSHPFVFVFYPFVQGEVRSYCADIIEEQKNLNKDSTMFVQIMKNSMKGFTVYDRSTLPEEDPDGEHLLEVLAQPGGAYGFNLRAGDQIQQKVAQLSSNNTGIGLSENITRTMQNIEDVSGVNGALQGKPGYSTTSGTLYQQQAQNATGSLLDVIEAFYSFLIKNSYKQASNMTQALDERQIDKIAGVGSAEVLKRYIETMNSETLELDFKMVEGATSAVYRQMVWDYANSWLQMGLIDMEIFLKITQMPLTDKLLVLLEQKNAQLMEQGQQALPDRIQQQQVAASVAGANAANGGANNVYNQLAQTKPVS